MDKSCFFRTLAWPPVNHVKPASRREALFYRPCINPWGSGHVFSYHREMAGWFETIWIIGFSLVTAYSAVALLVPEIRILYWKRTGKKLGTFSSLGLALLLWPLALGLMGVLPKSYLRTFGLGMMFLGFMMLVVGCVLDVYLSLDD